MHPATGGGNLLLKLAAEGMIPVLGGCAGALAGGPEAGFAGVAVGQVVEKAINFFGVRIVEQWRDWFRERPENERIAALAELAALSPQQARDQAAEALKDLRPDADSGDLSLAVEYLSAIPRTVERALVHDHGQVTVSISLKLDDPQSLFLLLPQDVPPYTVPGALPGTPYRLEQLLGSGGFGAVYRATAATLQHLPLAIKFCLDRSLITALRQERDHLERLMKAGGEGWSRRIVRLYGYDLEHHTPFLVYEYVPGGDLLHHLARLRLKHGRPLNHDEVFQIIGQLTEALSFAHAHGLVHRDLKPANVLVDDGQLKLADFGLGGVMAARAQVSRIGTTTVSLLTAAEQCSLFRGAGTPLYMSPEQRRGASPDPRHDLYSLGVIWYQLLVGDTARELHAGWAKELAVRYKVPREQIDLIENCVGWFDERPKDAGELLKLLGHTPITVQPVSSPPSPQSLSQPTDDERTVAQRLLLQGQLRQLRKAHREVERHNRFPMLRVVFVSILVAFGLTYGFGALIAYVVRHPNTSLGDEFSNSRMDTGGLVSGMVVGLLIFSLVLALQFLIWHWQRRRAQAELAQLTESTWQQYREVLTVWGGRVILDDPASIDTLAHHIETTPTLVPDPARQDRYRRSLQVSLLQRLGELLTQKTNLRNVPWAHLIAIALLPSWLLGHLFGEAIYSIRNPHYGFFNTFGNGPFDLVAVVSGVAMGSCWLAGLLLAQYVNHVRNTRCIEKTADRVEQQIIGAFPDRSANWGGAAFLRHAEAVTTLAERLGRDEMLAYPPAELRERLLERLRELNKIHVG